MLQQAMADIDFLVQSGLDVICCDCRAQHVCCSAGQKMKIQLRLEDWVHQTILVRLPVVGSVIMYKWLNWALS